MGPRPTFAFQRAYRSRPPSPAAKIPGALTQPAGAGRSTLDVTILRQPTGSTCGPACLYAIYEFWGRPVPLDRLVREVRALEWGGTLGVILACHALRQGYRAALYSYNLQIFDPTWHGLPPATLATRLAAQRPFKEDPRLHLATDAYREYFELGGELRFDDLSEELVAGFLAAGRPVIAGLSATYLYSSKREREMDGAEDDLRGEPVGHFVVLCGHDRAQRKFRVADPLQPNPLAVSGAYAVSVDRLIGAIFLGILTYDANLIVIEPKPEATP